MVEALWASTQFSVSRFPHYLRLKNLGASLFTPKVQIDFENQFYQVKTIGNAEELSQILKLRYNVFFKEFSSQPLFPFLTYDVDLYDFICDHLVVKDKSDDKIVACYRLLPSSSEHKIKSYYSEGEFEIQDFLKAPGIKIELGRACVDKNFRSGQVIGLLWKGLCEYAKKSNARYMFGCSSICSKDFKSLSKITKYIEQNDGFIQDYEIGVNKKFSIEKFEHLQLDLDPEAEGDRKALGSLMNMYLLAGAKFSKNMAYDKEMDCLDLFTIFDLTKMPASFERRFSC